MNLLASRNSPMGMLSSMFSAGVILPHAAIADNTDQPNSISSFSAMALRQIQVGWRFRFRPKPRPVRAGVKKIGIVQVFSGFRP